MLVRDHIIWPNGLAIDYVTKRIYWLDAKLFTLNSIDYDGNNRKVILRSDEYIKHPFALDVFEDYVYWSDWELEAVMRTNKFGAENGTVERVVGGVFSVMDVRVVHPFVQPQAPNRCQTAQCSHLCLPTAAPTYYLCECPAHMKLQPDGKTCVPASPATTIAPGADDLNKAHSEEHTTRATDDSHHARPHPHDPHHAKKGNEINHLLDGADSDEGHHTALIVISVLTSLSVLVALLVLVVYRNYQR